MIEVEPAQYELYVPWAKRCACNRVYPLSVAEGFQSGSIFADKEDSPECVLFWHACGFAYLVGAVSEMLLEEIATEICFLDKRRMVLITDDARTVEWLIQKNLAVAKRLEYGFAGTAEAEHTPDIRITRIDRDNIRSVTGRIVPSFSWEEDRFLNNGFGFAAFDRETYCGCAFSAAVSSEEVDVGVEVDAEHRGRGIASALVRRMCGETVSQGKKPVWAHSMSNAGSMHTAVKCGFYLTKTNCCAQLKAGE